MTHFAGKAVKGLVLSVAAVLLLTASALAAEEDLAVAVGRDHRFLPENARGSLHFLLHCHHFG